MFPKILSPVSRYFREKRNRPLAELIEHMRPITRKQFGALFPREKISTEVVSRWFPAAS